jgi:hypothetical protein
VVKPTYPVPTTTIRAGVMLLKVTPGVDHDANGKGRSKER